MAAEKRTLEEDGSLNTSTYLLDIEGTTTSISFVKDTLFPHVKQNLEKYVKENWEKEEFQKLYALFIEQSEKDEADKVEGVIVLKKDEENAAEKFVKNVLWQMDSDRKTGCLKTLQGQIYVAGYEKGELKGHVYPDFAPALKKWNSENKSIFIYSSGSVEAQKLLFGHSVDGDLTEFIKDYYDTEIGAKVEKESYVKIAEKIGKESSDITFFTDVVKEAEAAKEAGLKVVLVQRETTEDFPEEIKGKFEVIKTFAVEDSASPSKKRKIEEEEKKVEAEEVKEDAKEVTPPETTEKPAEETTPVVEEPKEDAETEKMETEEKKNEEAKVTENGEKEAENGTTEANGHTNGVNGNAENGHTNGDVKEPEEKKTEDIEPIPVKKLDTDVTPAGDAAAEPAAATTE